MASSRGREIEVLFWANLNPNKRGSFEDYICRLSSLCKENGVRIKFALGNEINDSLRTLFNQYSVDYFPLLSKELNSIWTMIRVLKNFKPKIIHFNFIGFASPLILLSKVMGVNKIILTEHTSTYPSNQYSRDGSILESLKRMRRQFIIKKIDHFIAVSNFVSERLKNRSGIPAEKVSVIYNGVDLERFKPPADELEKAQLKRNYFDVDQSVSVVTYIGQFIKEKGLNVYLEAIQKILKNYKDIVFVFVGAGPLEASLLHIIKQTQNNMVRFLGFRDDAEFILRASDVAVVPSVWEEAFGLVIAEALACGVPVIGSQIGGIPEVILDRETGILVRPGDADELADAIEQLVYDKKLKQYYSEMGRKHVENKFDLKIQVSETIKLYKHFLKDLSTT